MHGGRMSLLLNPVPAAPTTQVVTVPAQTFTVTVQGKPLTITVPAYQITISVT